MNKKLARKCFKTFNTILNNTRRVNLLFNNNSSTSNSYQFKFINNTLYLNDSLNPSKDIIEENLRGVDRKISLVEDFKVSEKEFSMQANKHYNFRFIYSTKLLLVKFFKDKSYTELNIQPNLDKDNLIFLLIFYLSEIKKQNPQSVDKTINELTEYFEKHKVYLESLHAINTEKYKLLNSKTISRQKGLVDIGIALSAIWTLTFFSLIFKIYSWDVIEPTTYIAGNCLLIIQYTYFFLKKRKLSPNLPFDKSTKDDLKLKEEQNLNYDKDFDTSIVNEMKQVEIILKYLKNNIRL